MKSPTLHQRLTRWHSISLLLLILLVFQGACEPLETGDCDAPPGHGVDWRRCDKPGAQLEWANLRHADLQYVDLSGADLSWADLSYANLQNANLSLADLEHADLDNADLESADLQAANLWWASLYRANLESANLCETNLRFSTLTLADLTGANLSRTDLFGSFGLTVEQTSKVLWNNTFCPNLSHSNATRPETCFPVAVSSVVLADSFPPDATSVVFVVKFNQAVSGVDVDDFTLTITGTLSDVIITGVSGSGATYKVMVNTGNGEGTLRLDVIDNESINSVVLRPNGYEYYPLGGEGANNGDFTRGKPCVIQR